MTVPLTGHHVLLRAGRLRLLLPQASVSTADYREGEPRPTGRRGVFEVTVAGEPRQVVFPSDRLTPLEELESPGFVLTQLRVPGFEELWLAWDEVRVFIDAEVAARPLPPVLREGSAMPSLQQAELDDQLVLCADAADVALFLCANLETDE